MQNLLLEKLVTEVHHYRNKPFLKAVMAVCALATLADDEVKLSERYRIFHAFAREPALRELDINKAVDDDYIFALRQEGDAAKEVLYKKISRMAGQHKRARTLMRVAYLIMIADDDVHDAEMQEFRQLCALLDLEPGQVWDELSG
jgi:tellurite resistance protein TerB